MKYYKCTKISKALETKRTTDVFGNIESLKLI